MDLACCCNAGLALSVLRGNSSALLACCRSRRMLLRAITDRPSAGAAPCAVHGSDVAAAGCCRMYHICSLARRDKGERGGAPPMPRFGGRGADPPPRPYMDERPPRPFMDDRQVMRNNAPREGRQVRAAPARGCAMVSKVRHSIVTRIASPCFVGIHAQLRGCLGAAMHSRARRSPGCAAAAQVRLHGRPGFISATIELPGARCSLAPLT